MGEGREIQEKRRILTTYSSALAAIMTLPYLLIFQTACLQIRKLPREVFFFLQHKFLGLIISYYILQEVWGWSPENLCIP